MRTAKFGILLLILVLAGCLFSLKTLERCVAQTTQQLKAAQALAQAGNLNAAAQAADGARRSWERWEAFLGSVLRHDEADDLRFAFARLSGFAAENDRNEFRAECAELIARVEHILTMEQPKLHNFLVVVADNSSAASV